jgi:hypothetical protein
VSKILRVSGKGQVQFVGRRQAGTLAEDLGTRVAVIQALIPLGLEAVRDVLQREVEDLAGARYAREGGRPGHVRWSKERGSVYLGIRNSRSSISACAISSATSRSRSRPTSASSSPGPWMRG